MPASPPTDPYSQAVSDLANALQTAAPLAERLSVTSVQQARDAATLRHALERAVEAVRALRRRPDDPTDPRRV